MRSDHFQDRAIDLPPFPKREWVTKKPDLPDKECLLAVTTYIRDSWYTNIYQFTKIEGEDGWYMGIVDAADGDEWGDYEDMAADLWMIIPLPEKQKK